MFGSSKKRYFAFSDYLKEKYGEKVYKITLDAGFSCPNRDGKISTGGCIFCDASGSFSQAHSNLLPIEQQVQTGINSLSDRFGANKFLAYFQAYSNTYADVEKLKKIYDSAFCDEKIVGISIGTRPDCVDEQKLDLISNYKNVWLELGLQTAHDETLKKVNRGHDFECFVEACKMAKERNIKVCAHVILGLPDETPLMMTQTAQELAKLNVDGVKLHSLVVLKDAPLYEIYNCGNFKALEMEEYCNLACDFMEFLPKTTTIHRLAGSGYSKTLVAPLWANKKFETLNLIDKIFEQRNTYQSYRFCNI